MRGDNRHEWVGGTETSRIWDDRGSKALTTFLPSTAIGLTISRLRLLVLTV